MRDQIAIPDLGEPYIIGLSVCARLYTTNKAVLSNLAKLDAGGMTAKAKKSTYVEVFGGLKTPVKKHLHVNVLLRSPKWENRKKTEIRPLSAVQTTLEQFVGTKAVISISGKFLVPMKTLSKQGIIRSAMDDTGYRGKVRLTSQTISISDGPVRELDWKLLPGGKYVAVQLEVEKSTTLTATYLRDCADFVVSAFGAMIFTERKNVTSNN